MNNFEILRKNFQAKTKEERIDFLNVLGLSERLFFYKNPDLFLFDKQIIPETNDWVYYLLRCGRSFGKTYAGSACLTIFNAILFSHEIANNRTLQGYCIGKK